MVNSVREDGKGGRDEEGERKEDIQKETRSTE